MNDGKLQPDPRNSVSSEIPKPKGVSDEQWNRIDPDTLTAEDYLEVLQKPKTQEDFVTMSDRKEAMDAALDEIAKTDPERAEAIKDQVEFEYKNRDDWHARWGHPKTSIPPKERDQFLRDATRVMESEKTGNRTKLRNELSKKYKHLEKQDKAFYDEVWDTITANRNQPDLIKNKIFLNDEALEQKIEFLEDVAENGMSASSLIRHPVWAASLGAMSMAPGLYASELRNELSRRRAYRDGT